ncbi:SAM-dependent methyltransferase [Anaerobacillus arseniciselenatis]|uniref:SAM-dependent methyltransferase n=1 Tax=Anaerobacillus arseniciselenatis TaxID=85682 RepID=A0A1S2LVS7_9BACI|nr:methyltransferase domain-containing protein [Anaerobacillus arseniciselenatis]OIJ16273.1 SAM-dependent methyltransferase [Anaerobacillus arseniciselenatis]
MTKGELKEALMVEQFPLSAKYDPQWMIRNDMGPNSVWLTEYLAKAMDFKPGMKILDMGCGKAMSSIFLAKEFGVQVWANDLWITATDNWRRIKEAGVEDLVFPIRAEAHALPYAKEFFDAIISIDSYHYYGTNELYLFNFVELLKPNGQIGIVVPGLMKEFEDEVPVKLKPYWDSEWYTYHSPNWWSKLWRRSGLVDIEVSDTMPNGWNLWLKWETTAKQSGFWGRNGDIELLTADGGEYFTFTRLVARRR